MDPATILMALSAGSKALGAYYGYHSAGAEAEFNSEVHQINQELALFSADQAIIRGEQNAAIKRLETRQMVGDQIATIGASGLVIGEGTMVDVVNDTETLGMIDAQIILHNAEMEAQGFELEAAGHGLRSELALMRGESKQTGELLGLGADLFGMAQDFDLV